MLPSRPRMALMKTVGDTSTPIEPMSALPKVQASFTFITIDRYLFMQQFSDDVEGDPTHTSPQQTPDNPKGSSIARLFKNTLTNLSYNIKHSNFLPIPNLQRKRIQLDKDSPPVHLLGSTYQYPDQEKFCSHFRDTVWLTYRKGIKNLGDDTGWGCMIRATQMMIAEAIKRSTHQKSVQVLKYFEDQTEGQLSLSNICQHGKITQRWTTASEIMSNCKEIIQNISQLKLAVGSINEGYIILRNIIDQVHKHKGKSYLLVIHNRVGLKNLDQLNFPHLKELMRLKQFVGVLGGQPGEAIYIIGFSGDEVMFLDPHYVQDSCGSDTKYFKHTPRGIEMSKLSACISIGFFVKDELDMTDLIENLYGLEQYYRSHRIVELVLDEREKEQLERSTRKDRKVSLDEFQMIQ